MRSLLRACGLALFLSALASAATVVWQNTRLTVLWDLSYILENAWRIASGDVPYRNFPFPYAPATFYNPRRMQFSLRYSF